MSERDDYPDWLDESKRSVTVTRAPELVAQVEQAWATEFDNESDFYVELMTLVNELNEDDLLPADILRGLKAAVDGGRVRVEIVDE